MTRERETITPDMIRERIRTDEITDNDFFACFEDITDKLDWLEFADDWRKIFEAAIGIEIHRESIYGWLITSAAADGWYRGVAAAARALGVKTDSLQTVLSYYYEDGIEDRPEPGFGAVKHAILEYERWMEKVPNE